MEVIKCHVQFAHIFIKTYLSYNFKYSKLIKSKRTMSKNKTAILRT